MGVDVEIHVFLTSVLVAVSGLHHAVVALSPVLYKSLGGSQSWSGEVKIIENIGTRNLTPQSPSL